MKQAMKESAPFQREGIMSISRSLSGNVDAKVKRWVESAKRQGQDLNKDFSYKPFIGQGKKRQGSLFSLRKGGKNKKSKQLKFKFKKSQVK